MSKFLLSCAGLLLLSACAGQSDDPESAERRRCRIEAEAVRMQVEQQEAQSAPRITMQNGAMAPMSGSSMGYSAYRSAYADCMRARAAERPVAPKP